MGSDAQARLQHGGNPDEASPRPSDLPSGYASSPATTVIGDTLKPTETVSLSPRTQLPKKPSRDKHNEASLVRLVATRVVLPTLLLLGLGAGLIRLRAILAPQVNVPEVIIRLRAGGSARWQAVAYITPFLYDRRYKDLRRDAELAAALADALSEELDQPLAGYADMSVAARAHLCRMLRYMDTPEVIPPLAKAIQWRQGGSPEIGSPVRRAAAESDKEMADRLGNQILYSHGEVLPALLYAVEDPVDPVRAAAALTLGLHGGDSACEKLETLLGDSNPTVRYNAAIGLAMAGDASGIAILEELLLSRETRTLAETGNLDSINGMRTRRLLVLSLRSVDRLMDMDPRAPVEELRPALTQLQYSLVPEDVKQLALQLEVKMNQRVTR